MNSAVALQLKCIFEEKLLAERARRLSTMEKYTIPEVSNEDEWLYLTGQASAAAVFESTPTVSCLLCFRSQNWSDKIARIRN